MLVKCDILGWRWRFLIGSREPCAVIVGPQCDIYVCCAVRSERGRKKRQYDQGKLGSVGNVDGNQPRIHLRHSPVTGFVTTLSLCLCMRDYPFDFRQSLDLWLPYHCVCVWETIRSTFASRWSLPRIDLRHSPVAGFLTSLSSCLCMGDYPFNFWQLLDFNNLIIMSGDGRPAVWFTALDVRTFLIP
jgi:hypothetical protein